MVLSLVAVCLLAAPLAAQGRPAPKPTTDAPAPKPTPTSGDEGPSGADGEGAPELTKAADVAIEKGLKYLLASQNRDGSWASKDGRIAIGGTSLGLMAFMAKGVKQRDGHTDYFPALKAGWSQEQGQDKEKRHDLEVRVGKIP